MKYAIHTAVLSTLLFASGLTVAQSAPGTGGVISNPTLVANSDVAKAQAVGIITSFMSDGASTCDENGTNCRSLFGTNDDSLDYTSLQSMSKSVTGISNFSFMGGSDGTDSNSISAQTGTLALACGDYSVKTVAGIAFKASSCLVNSSGDAQLTYQICTAPSRGNPVAQPTNAVECSTDPASPNFKAPVGKVCMRAACDTEPVNSHNGWSEPLTISWKQSLPESATEDEKSKNGLGLSFYPLLGGSVSPSFTADSDNMTAVKVVQTFINNETQKTAVGLRMAYRAKATVTREMLIAGPSAVPNPGEHTSQWDTLLKLQSNPLIPQYQAQYAKDGSDCIRQIQEGIGTDGVISVCDQGYTNESGIKPGQLTAVIAPEGKECGTTTTCLKEVINTNSWSQVCNADVPLALRTCETTTDYTEEKLYLTRTRPVDICTEERLVAEFGCETAAVVTGVAPKYCAAGTVLVNNFTPNACSNCIDNWQTYRITCLAAGQVRVEWYTNLSNGSRYSTIVDRTLTVEPYEESYNQLGPFCFDGSGTVPFQVSCNNQYCQYTSWITGNCNGAAFGLRAVGYADVNFTTTYDLVNACTVYENAK